MMGRIRTGPEIPLDRERRENIMKELDGLQMKLLMLVGRAAEALAVNDKVFSVHPREPEGS